MMEYHNTTGSPAQSTSRPHLRACSSCARAKVKCVAADGSNSKCQRCERLGKPCEPSLVRARAPPRRRRASETKRAEKHRVESLEQKLDGLVTLLKHGQDIPNVNIGSPRFPTSFTEATNVTSAPTVQLPATRCHLSSTKLSTEDPVAWEVRLHEGGPIRQRFGLEDATNTTNTVLAPLLKPPAKIIDSWDDSNPSSFTLPELDMGAEDPEQMLDRFRNEMNPNFPFVSIPDQLYSTRLRRTKPSLYTAIMAVTSRDTARQAKIDQLFVRQIAERIVVNGHRNLDLLLAILTYLAWNILNFHDIPQITSLLTCATTLIADLRLNRPPPKDQSGGEKHLQSPSHVGSLHPGGRKYEERRAVLGYWYLNAVLNPFFHRLENPVWLPYLDECLQVLSTSSDHRHDRFTVALVRIQLVGERIANSPWRSAPSSDQLVAAAIPSLVVHSIQNQINTIQKEFAWEVDHNVHVFLSLRSIEVSLYKIGLSKSPALATFNDKDFNRLNYLFACTQAVRSFFETYIAIPAAQYHTLPFISGVQVAWNSGVLQLLSTFEHPDWDLSWVRNTISFTGTLYQLADRYTQCKQELRIDPHTASCNDIYSQSAIMFRVLADAFAAKHGTEQSRESSELTGQLNPEMLDFLIGDGVDFLDDSWMRDFMGPWNPAA